MEVAREEIEPPTGKFSGVSGRYADTKGGMITAFQQRLTICDRAAQHHSERSTNAEFRY
jgi:hypothetical protein